ncbi:MAG: hypothetical protein DCC75_04690, partial [Proteobacteria bacterium]
HHGRGSAHADFVSIPHHADPFIGGVFAGKSVVITGSLSSMSRKEAEEAVQAQSGKVSSAVSKRTDYVLVGEEPGSKFERAKELGVRILSEAEFVEMVK